MSVGSGVLPRVTLPASRPTFAEVAEAHLDSVYRYLVHMTRNRDLADDLTSATFERALKDWRRYDPRKGEPKSWLVQVARRVALDHLRSEGRRRAREARYAAGEPGAEEAPEPRGAIGPGLRVAEVPAVLRARARGRSKMRILRTARAHLRLLRDLPVTPSAG